MIENTIAPVQKIKNTEEFYTADLKPFFEDNTLKFRIRLTNHIASKDWERPDSYERGDSSEDLNYYIRADGHYVYYKDQFSTSEQAIDDLYIRLENAVNKLIRK